MSKAKKAAQPAPAKHEEKGFFALAGEAFAVLGEEIVDGKDKVVEVAAAKITSVKNAINKITHKKAAKKTAKKAPAKRASVAKKTVKKAATPPKKTAKKAKAAPKKKAKAAPKKAAKKKAVGRKR
jgi:hypothetical protein